MNVCVNCGVSTNDDICPNGCKSIQDPTKPKPTIPWSMIPTHCWDCGKPIATPPNLRKFQGQCDDYTAKALGEVN